MAKKPKGIWDIVDTVNDVFGKGKRPSDEFYGGSLGDFKDAVKTAAQFSAQAANPVLESYARNVALPQAGGQKANWKRFAGEQAIGAAVVGGAYAIPKVPGVVKNVANAAQDTGLMSKLTEPIQTAKDIALRQRIIKMNYESNIRRTAAFVEKLQNDIRMMEGKQYDSLDEALEAFGTLDNKQQSLDFWKNIDKKELRDSAKRLTNQDMPLFQTNRIMKKAMDKIIKEESKKITKRR